MPIKLNTRGAQYAKGRISRGKIDYDSEWEFSDEERNALFADGFSKFSEWHLGTDTDEEDGTAASHLFAYGKDGMVFRSALSTVISKGKSTKKKRKASSEGLDAIVTEASALRDLIDNKRENAHRIKFIGSKDNQLGYILLDAAMPIVLATDADMVEGGGAEGWTQIARTGTFLGHWQGPFSITEDDLSVMKINFDRFVNPALVDYGHDSVWDAAAIAAGWGKEFEIGKKGQALYSKIEWTREAEARIRSGELKFISPVIFFSTEDPYTAEDLGPSVWTIALLNTPFLDAMDPVEIGGQIAASRKTLKGAPPNRAWAVPRTMGAAPIENETIANNQPEPEPVIEPEPAEITIATDNPEEDDVDRKELTKKLGLPEDATDAQIFQAMADQQTKADADKQALADATARADKAEADHGATVQQLADRDKAEAEALVESYCKAGRIAPASKERACKLALEDRESFYACYGKQDEPGAAVAPMHPVATPDPGTGASMGTTLTEDEIDAAKKLGTTPEKFAAEKQRRLDKGLLGKKGDLPDNPRITRV